MIAKLVYSEIQKPLDDRTGAPATAFGSLFGELRAAATPASQFFERR